MFSKMLILGIAIFILLDNHVGNANTIYVGDNSSVLLECNDPYYHHSNIQWQGPYGGGTIYFSGGTINQKLPAELRNRLELVPTSDQPIDQYVDDLRINAFNTRDEGTYTCRTISMNVYIKELPNELTIQNVTKDGRFVVIENDNATIICTAKGGKPVPYVYLVLNNTIHESLTQSVELTISSFPRTYDNEVIICIANTTTEAYDSLNVTAQIRVTYVPDEPTRLVLAEISETSATIQWLPGASGGYEQMFYVEYKITGNNQWTRIQIPVQDIIVKQETRLSYRLAVLLPGNMYEIRLFSSNQLGDSELTEGIVFMTAFKAECHNNGLVIASSLLGVSLGIVVILFVLLLLRNRISNHVRSWFSTTKETRREHVNKVRSWFSTTKETRREHVNKVRSWFSTTKETRREHVNKVRSWFSTTKETRREHVNKEIKDKNETCIQDNRGYQNIVTESSDPKYMYDVSQEDIYDNVEIEQDNYANA